MTPIEKKARETLGEMGIGEKDGNLYTYCLEVLQKSLAAAELRGFQCGMAAAQKTIQEDLSKGLRSGFKNRLDP